MKSNRESGTGRADLILRTPSVRGKAYIIEIKAAGSLGAMKRDCEDALKQIRDRGYQSELTEEGFTCIWKYGICFWKKEAAVKLEK